MMNIQQLEAVDTMNQAIRYLINLHKLDSSGGRIAVIEALQILQHGRDVARGIVA